jgi:hypothetical protein
VTITDSDALRSRRKRLHASGDHSLCRATCDERRVRQLSPVRPVAVPAAGLNPRDELTDLARRLVEAHLAYPDNAMIARELRVTLLAIEAGEPAAADPMDELRAMAARVS